MSRYTVERAAENLPQSTQAALFTVSGGRVAVTEIIGEVTTVLQASGTDDTKLVFNPSVGSDSDLGTSLDIMAYSAVGTLFWLDGLTSPLQHGVFTRPIDRPLILPLGSVDLNCAASKTGQIKWTLVYAPLDPGAKVVAA